MSQSDFAAALLNPDLPAPEGLVDAMGRPAVRRFDVYRNNVTQGLGKALEAGFPAVLALVGVDFFRAMALVFLRAHPPKSRIMMLYGAEFAGFIAGFPPAQSLGYLADVARLEQMIRESYHAGDAPALAPEVLTRLSDDQLLAARLTLAPSLRLLRSDWPVHSIWAATLHGGPSPQMRAEDVLITRPGFDPVCHLLPIGGAGFIGALRAGATVEQAAKTCPEGFDLGQTLALLAAQQTITGLDG